MSDPTCADLSDIELLIREREGKEAEQRRQKERAEDATHFGDQLAALKAMSSAQHEQIQHLKSANVTLSRQLHAANETTQELERVNTRLAQQLKQSKPLPLWLRILGTVSAIVLTWILAKI